MTSFYNGYDLDGRTQMEPHRPVQPLHPDPFNGSSEWYPNKIGISIGIRIYDPELHRQRSETRRLRKAPAADLGSRMSRPVPAASGSVSK